MKQQTYLLLSLRLNYFNDKCLLPISLLSSSVSVPELRVQSDPSIRDPSLNLLRESFRPSSCSVGSESDPEPPESLFSLFISSPALTNKITTNNFMRIYSTNLQPFELRFLQLGQQHYRRQVRLFRRVPLCQMPPIHRPGPAPPL